MPNKPARAKAITIRAGSYRGKSGYIIGGGPGSRPYSIFVHRRITAEAIRDQLRANPHADFSRLLYADERAATGKKR